MTLGEILWQQIRCGVLLSVIFLALAQAATPLQGYVQRVAEAAELATDIADNDYGREQETEILARLQSMLPPTEAIARSAANNDIVHVDNNWLHESIKTLNTKDETNRAAQLSAMAERLQALARQLTAVLQPANADATNDSQTRLKQILNRPEYQPEAEQESQLQAWWKKMRKRINDFLAKLFGGKQTETAAATDTGIGFLQILLAIGLAAVLLWALISLLSRLAGREAKRKSAEELTDVREVLGEQLAAHVTVDDLLQEATALAQRGEYRLAVRRAYIATLYQLEKRGKLRLHRAKTNSDYLRELWVEKKLYAPVSTMTNRYEHVWYGNTAATHDDYVGFIASYNEVTK